MKMFRKTLKSQSHLYEKIVGLFQEGERMQQATYSCDTDFAKVTDALQINSHTCHMKNTRTFRTRYSRKRKLQKSPITDVDYFKEVTVRYYTN
jgi:hypothetical protein